jgi:hypothetical protein
MAPFEDEEDDKNRLFETHQTSSRSIGNYVRLLLIVAACVAVVGFVISYFTLPGIGDKVRAPKGLEEQIRDHLSIKEKRSATDMTFYYCGTSYWVAVEVETRPDIPDSPINRVSRYRVNATQADNQDWNLTSTPVTGTDPDVPCSPLTQ